MFIEKNDAVVFNMHLLTSDIFAAIFTYFFFDDVGMGRGGKKLARAMRIAMTVL